MLIAFPSQKNADIFKKKIKITLTHNPEWTTVNILVCSLLDFVCKYIHTQKADIYENSYIMLFCMHMLWDIVIPYMTFSL